MLYWHPNFTFMTCLSCSPPNLKLKLSDKTQPQPSTLTKFRHKSAQSKVRVTVHPWTGHEGPEREQTHGSTLSLTSSLDGVGCQRHAQVALIPGKRSDSHYIGEWVSLRTGLDGCGKSRPPARFDPRTVQPLASRCTDWAIAAKPPQQGNFKNI
jgi:hypothetical protein